MVLAKQQLQISKEAKFEATRGGGDCMVHLIAVFGPDSPTLQPWVVNTDKVVVFWLYGCENWV